jgi:F-type H+-transporting ATPase subunit b
MSRRCGYWRLAVIIIAVSLAAAPALAAQENEHAEPSIFEGGLHNAIWTLLIFLTVVLVLGKFAWGPLLGALKQREDFIRESLETAKKEREESTELLKKYTEQINRAREEATAITQEGRRDAEEVKKRIQAEARAEADAIIKRAKREIVIAHQDAITEIYNAVAELSTQIAERVLSREIDAEEHRELLNAALDEVREQRKLPSN